MHCKACGLKKRERKKEGEGEKRMFNAKQRTKDGMEV